MCCLRGRRLARKLWLTLAEMKNYSHPSVHICSSDNVLKFKICNAGVSVDLLPCLHEPIRQINGMSLPDILLDVAMATGSQEMDQKDQCSHMSADSGMAISQESCSEKTVSPELPSPVSG